MDTPNKNSESFMSQKNANDDTEMDGLENPRKRRLSRKIWRLSRLLDYLAYKIFRLAVTSKAGLVTPPALSVQRNGSL